MRTSEIENFQRKRYIVMKGLTISYPFFITPMIVNSYLNMTGEYKFIQVFINTPILIIGTIFFSIFLFKMVRLIRKINTDPVLKGVLYDEYYQRAQSKVFRNSFMGFIVITGISILLSSLFPVIPATSVCFMIFLIVYMTGQVSWLIYNRE